MKTKILMLITLTFVIIGSCTKDMIQPKIAPVVPVNPNTKFSTDVYPIFATYSCTQCHGSSGGLTLSGTAPETRTSLLQNAVVPNSSATSKFYNYFHGTSHMGKTLTATEVSNIKSWIDSGALDN